MTPVGPVLAGDDGSPNDAPTPGTIRPVAPVDLPDGCLEAARSADAKLGVDTVIMAMGELLGVTEAFVVTAGRNNRQVKTIVDAVEHGVKEGTGRSPLRVEGLRDQQWVLMDYGDFLVHVFLDETRDFYDLEHLWGNAPRVDWAEPA